MSRNARVLVGKKLGTVLQENNESALVLLDGEPSGTWYPHRDVDALKTSSVEGDTLTMTFESGTVIHEGVARRGPLERAERDTLPAEKRWPQIDGDGLSNSPPTTDPPDSSALHDEE